MNYASTHMLQQPSKFTQLRTLLKSPDLRFIMEAHSALSAKIVEEAGFEGIWASGLSMSAALGVRDNNELSWTQVLDQLEYMSDAVSIPILVDGDTGYGNFNNFRMLVKKLCQRGVAGVCIEDKVFPKTNSFLGDNQALADIDEFCGKIKAGKDTQEHEDFSVVARVEALISGRGMEEALKRAAAYADAGADAILIHSKKSDPAEILEFCSRWDNRKPLVVVPTKYYRVPTARLREAGISLVIWANHNLRSSIQAMRDTSRTLFSQQTLLEVEHEVAPLEDVFALAGAKELEEAEKRYLATEQPQTAAIILAATRGSGLGDLTEDRPKCMVNVRGQSILERQLAALKRHGISSVTVVTGYKSDAVDLPGIKKAVNADYASTGEAASLAKAADVLSGRTIISYGDIVYRPFFLSLLSDRKEDFVVLADPNARSRDDGKSYDYVTCSTPFTGGLGAEDEASLTAIGETLDRPDGEWVGLLGVSAAGSKKLREELALVEAEGRLGKADMAELLTRLMAKGEKVGVVYVSGNWMNVNDVVDLAQARNEM